MFLLSDRQPGTNRCDRARGIGLITETFGTFLLLSSDESRVYPRHIHRSLFRPPADTPGVEELIGPVGRGPGPKAQEKLTRGH